MATRPGAPDLSPFDEMNKKDTKPTWNERYVTVQEQFPSVVKLDWYQVFSQDPHIMGRIVGDILKIDQAPKGRVGKRASLDREKGEAMFRQLVGEDFTLRPFNEAFATLVAGRSLRGMANRLGVSHTHVRNLLNGTTSPSAEIMEKAADVFKKRPEYWLEWRIGYILGLLAGRLDGSPEASVTMYRRLQQDKKAA